MEKNFKTKKSLGQHFLINEVIIHNIISSCNDLDKKVVLEIGSGDFALTKELVKYAKKVIAIEKDIRLKEKLEKFKTKNDNFQYFLADALKFNPLEIIDIKNQQTILVANLPYNVGTQIYLDYLLKYPIFDYFVLMFQKEVAKRIMAEVDSSNYGRLSIISSLLARKEFLFEVDKECFNPPPKVQSAVIKIFPLKESLYQVDLNKLEALTKLAFQGRRKTIKNSLKSLNINFDILEINPNKRPQEISLKEFCVLANNIKNNK